MSIVPPYQGRCGVCFPGNNHVHAQRLILNLKQYLTWLTCTHNTEIVEAAIAYYSIVPASAGFIQNLSLVVY